MTTDPKSMAILAGDALRAYVDVLRAYAAVAAPKKDPTP